MTNYILVFLKLRNLGTGILCEIIALCGCLFEPSFGIVQYFFRWYDEILPTSFWFSSLSTALLGFRSDLFSIFLSSDVRTRTSSQHPFNFFLPEVLPNFGRKSFWDFRVPTCIRRTSNVYFKKWKNIYPSIRYVGVQANLRNPSICTFVGKN